MNKKYARTLAENNKFRFYCTSTPEMLLRGIDVELNMFSDQNECKKQLITKLKSNIKNIQQFDLLLYLPGGVPFLKGELKDIFSNKVKPEVKRNIYGVLTRPIQNEDLNKNYTRLPDLTKDQKKFFYSPICESTSNGLCDIACLLDYCKQNGKYCSKFQNILSSIIPFPPFSTCLRQLIENKYFTERDIITITSTLHTFF